MTNHTPGPWNAVVNPDGMPSFQVLSFFRASIESDGAVVAYLPELGHEDTTPTLKANAQLIAKAPEIAALLDLARAWLDALDASEDDGEDELSVDTGHAFYVALRAFDANAEDRP